VRGSPPPRPLSASYPDIGLGSTAEGSPGRTGVIVEVAEPASESGTLTKIPGKSYLTHLLRNSPPETESEQEAEAEAQQDHEATNDGPAADDSRLPDSTKEPPPTPKGQPARNDTRLYDAIQRPNGDAAPYHDYGAVSGADLTMAIAWPTGKGLSVMKSLLHKRKMWRKQEIWENMVVKPVGCLPAVLLGLLLNVLDGLSYGEYLSQPL